MRILVTGGAGFIGSHVVEGYLAEGHEVAVIDNLSTGRRSNVPRGATLFEVDIHARETERIFAEFRPEVVNHHAAQSSVKVSTEDPVHDMEVNGAGTARIVELAARYGARKVIYASSGGTVYGQPETLPVPEDHPIRPLSPYGVSKYAGELYVEWASRAFGLDYTIFRYGNAYGPRQDPSGEAGVVANFIGRMLRGQPCIIDSDGLQQKDYLYVGDIVRANLLALERGSRTVLNIGTGRGTNVLEIFRAVESAVGGPAAFEHGPPRPGDVRAVWLDVRRAEEVLGWRAEVSLEEGIALTAAWFREQRAFTPPGTAPRD
jgi:UDP-glucose 4-epimerase